MRPEPTTAGIQREMSHFRERFDSVVPLTPGLSYAPRQFEPGSEVKMLVPRTEAAASRIILTSAVECNRSSAHASYQPAAFYLSALSAVFPGLLPLAKEYLQESGYTVREITEDTAAENRITLQRWTDVNTSLAVFGQLAVVIYKKFDDESYDWLLQRVAKIKYEAGVAGYLRPGNEDVLFSSVTARNIRTIVGGCFKIRVELLKAILANRDGHSRLNRVCKCVADTISWTDMEPLKFMFDSLYLTGSPVLKDIRVKHEVRNMREAYERVMEKQYPQYYCILHPAEAGVTIAKSRFETLAEVAARYKYEQNNPLNYYASSRNNTLEDTLVAVHRAYMTSTNPSASLD